MIKVPEEITIQLVDQNGQPYKQENIVIGIKTFATKKNDIHISPFYTNSDGNIKITRKDINKAVDNFTGLGLMDYEDLESAKLKIEIHVWTNEEIEKYINHWEPIIQRTNAFDYTEKKTVEKFKKSYNKNLNNNLSNNISDNWDGRQTKYHYDIGINVK